MAISGGHQQIVLMLQERDSVIDKLRSGMQELSLKCEAVSAQAEAAQPYERRYRDLQASPPFILLHATHA